MYSVPLPYCDTDRRYDARPVESSDAVRHEIADERFKSGPIMKLLASALIVILFDLFQYVKVTKEHHGD